MCLTALTHASDMADQDRTFEVADFLRRKLPSIGAEHISRAVDKLYTLMTTITKE